MKLYNQNEDKIETLPRQLVIANGSTVLVSSLTDTELNNEGYYRVEYGSQPNRRYYTSVENKALVDNVYKITYEAVDRPLADVKALLKVSIKERFLEKQIKPIVDTGLGFSVDGGYDKVKDFEIGKKYSFPSVKASDDTFYPVSATDYDTIISAIELYGIQLFQLKWAKEEEVNALATIDECILYEATPYDYTLTADDIAELSDAQVGDVVTRYRNNCKEW